jgi:UDP-2,3-diacylglucosamine pyrophosphatase LpxH
MECGEERLSERAAAARDLPLSVMQPIRHVYVISDLHLGGEYGTGTRPGDRGFRLCSQVRALTAFVNALSERPGDTRRTELIINGDFVDFLAERHTVEGSASPWMPFIANPTKAAQTLETIVDRDRPFFDALTGFLDRGHRLVVLLGNHDLELSLPCVRRTLVETLRAGSVGKRRADSGHDFEFIYDGEAYVVGDALIEHGDRCDAWNRVNHESLRRFRSRQSRHRPDVVAGTFTPPPGSRLVSEVINPIKADYRFVDLLKPETDAVVPLLLALEPGYRRYVGRLAALCVARTAASLPSTVTGDIASNRSSSESFGGDLVAGPRDDSRNQSLSDPLTALLHKLMPGKSDRFLELIGEGMSGDIAAGDVVNHAIGLAQLLAANRQHLIERRLSALLLALGVLKGQRPFDRGAESLSEYAEAAQALARRGFNFVIFGHTHIARDVQLAGGARYLNTGTWTDVIRFPAEVVMPGHDDELRRFVADLRTGALSRWVEFRPTYVRLDLTDGGAVSRAELVDYPPRDEV